MIYRTGTGFAMHVLGGNGRAARMVGISVAFIARQNALLIIPVAVLLSCGLLLASNPCFGLDFAAVARIP